MELQLKNGDYVPDGRGGAVRLTGDAALLQRVLFRLSARRGALCHTWVGAHQEGSP